jgi:BirA family transcriptional regulator, biotin operon repressor / biotin---[acetyl-CoA-carboxylase] ligase
MSSPWSDLDRPPLSEVRLNRALAGGPVWREIRVSASEASTNAAAGAAAREGAVEGLVLITEQQTAGRGRLDRQWSAPARAGVLMSVLLRPSVGVAAWPLLPLLSGLAVVEAMVGVAQVEAALKWPNDVMLDDRKLGGILVERVDDAVIVGVGLNVSTRADELPTEEATSLALSGGATDREIIVKEVLRALARRYLAWLDTGGTAASVIPAYRERCETIGRHIELLLPGGEIVRGVATGIDDSGRLVLRNDATGVDHAWLVGDVTHVRKVS